MKKSLGIICLMLLLVSIPAYASEVSFTWESTTINSNQMCILQNEVICLVKGAPYRLNVEQQTLQAMAVSDHLQGASFMLTDNVSLFAFDSEGGILWFFDNEGKWELSCTLVDWKALVQDSEMQIVDGVLTEKSLLINGYSLSTRRYETWIFSRQGGQRVSNIDSPEVLALSPAKYAEGIVAVLAYQDDLLWYGYLSDQGIFIPCGKVPDSSAGGLAWVSDKKFYYMVQNQLYQADENGSVRPIELLPASVTAEQRGLLLNQQYLLPTPRALITAATEPSASSDQVDTLTIYGGITSIEHEAAMTLLPGMESHLVDEVFFTDDMMYTQLLTRDPNVDIYFTDGPFVNAGPVMEKGFTLPLTSSETLTQATQQMFPVLQKLVIKDGQVMALPIYISYPKSILSENLPVLEEAEQLGFQPPANYLDFLDGIAQWDTALEEEGIFPLMGANLDDLYKMTLYQYIAACDPLNSESLPNSDLLKDLLVKTQKAIHRLEQMQTGQNSEFARFVYVQGGPQMYTEDYSGMRYLLLPLADGMQPALEIQVSFLFINPYSRHKQQAIQYLEAYWKMLPESRKVSIIQVGGKDVENPDYAANHKSMLNLIEEAEKRYNTHMDKPEGADDKASIDAYKAQLQRLEAQRYYITQDSISAYRKFMAYACVADRRLINNSSITPVLNAFVQGQMDIDHFVNRLSKMLETIRREDR